MRRLEEFCLRSLLHLIPRIPWYRLFWATGRPRPLPVNITVSVTNKCNSRCSTCFIWELYHDRPDLQEKEFNTDEFLKVFDSVGGSPFWVTLSGGEPFLRDDLPQICEGIVERSQPAIINIPSNGLLPDLIETKTKDILSRIGNTTLIINLSMDAVGERHDELRGVRGNFKALIETYRCLQSLKKNHHSFRVGIHTVISKLNIDDIVTTYEFVKELRPDSYVAEVAEERSELFNIGKDITPLPDSYAAVMGEFMGRIQKDYLSSGRDTSKVTQAFRLVYYQIAIEVLREHRQVIPCYAGVASCQITPFGDVWSCCTLGDTKIMGNLREVDYDFKRIWMSDRAKDVRKFIRDRNCACPLANAHYTSILCNSRALFRVASKMLRF